MRMHGLEARETTAKPPGPLAGMAVPQIAEILV
jgi:hypothetical protein